MTNIVKLDKKYFLSNRYSKLFGNITLFEDDKSFLNSMCMFQKAFYCELFSNYKFPLQFIGTVRKKGS